MPTLYQKNRKKLMKALPDGLIALPAGKETWPNQSFEYKFRQYPDFLYLTGINKPDHTLILDPKDGKSYLFIPDPDDLHRIWVGRQQTTAEAKKIYKPDFCYYNKDLVRIATKLTRKYKKIYELPGRPVTVKGLPKSIKRNTTRLQPTLHNFRLLKEPEEIQLMSKANRISHKAYVAAMKKARPNMHEYEAQAVIECHQLCGGSPFISFNTIAAAGPNAAILHYIDNNAPCRKGDLLLIDGGCTVEGYASDITRTFPVSGKFSKKQNKIYSIVLKANKECIQMIRPGISMVDLHEHASKTMLQGLLDLGIIKKGDVNDYYEKDVHRVFFPHGLGHLLGLDVHDVGNRPDKKLKKRAKHLRNYLRLEPSMVVTVEPGIYFIEAYFDSPEKRRKLKKYINWKKADAYRQVGGVRIEDDILVTKKGHRNLTSVPKEIKDIEKVMKTPSTL